MFADDLVEEMGLEGVVRKPSDVDPGDPRFYPSTETLGVLLGTLGSIHPLKPWVSSWGP